MMTVLEQFVTEKHNDSNDVTFETDLITLLSFVITNDYIARDIVSNISANIYEHVMYFFYSDEVILK